MQEAAEVVAGQVQDQVDLVAEEMELNPQEKDNPELTASEEAVVAAVILAVAMVVTVLYI